MKDSHKLRLAYYELEKFYRPFFDLLVLKQERYPDFKGGVTLNGYLNFNPDILILAYNPAHGKYRDYSYTGAHIVNQGERPFGFFEFSNARVNGNWWQRSLAPNNTFPANIIELLYSYAEAKGYDPEYRTDKKPSWFKALNIEKRIMILNLYPIATKDGTSLKRLLGQLRKDKEFTLNGSFHTEWDVRRYLLHKLQDFIYEYVKPKCIVCFGEQTISDFTFGKYHKTESGLLVANDLSNILGINRRGNWTKYAKLAGQEVAQKI